MPHTPIPEDLLRQQIGQRIADIRDLRGMSRIEFYERLGIERKLRFKPEHDQNFLVNAGELIRGKSAGLPRIRRTNPSEPIATYQGGGR